MVPKSRQLRAIYLSDEEQETFRDAMQMSILTGIMMIIAVLAGFAFGMIVFLKLGAVITLFASLSCAFLAFIVVHHWFYPHLSRMHDLELLAQERRYHDEIPS